MKKAKKQSNGFYFLNHLTIKLFSLLFLVLVLMPQHLLAQNEGTSEDQLIEQCLTFQPLLEKIPIDVNEQTTVYYILDHGIEFNFSPDLKINGKSVSLIAKFQIKQDMLYFDFFALNIENDKALITYYANYFIGDVEKIIPVTIHFEKNNSVWEVINYTI